jgi:hypothetical protein
MAHEAVVVRGRQPGSMIDPRAEEAMGKQIGATTINVGSSHAAVLSHPAAVADAIIAAASKVQ